MLTRAVLVKLTTDNGLVTVKGVAAGAVVQVELRSRHMRLLVHHATRREHACELVLANIDNGARAWLPTECLRIED